MNRYLLGMTIILLLGCLNNPRENIAEKSYPKTVGDIKFDPAIDGNFTPCNDFSNQYYGPANGVSFRGEMSTIKKEIFKNYKSIGLDGQTGFYTIRFLVNCHGDAGLFRAYSVDTQLKEFTFDDRISEELLKATKSLTGWKVATYEGVNYDYYQYLTFKIVDSELKEITP